MDLSSIMASVDSKIFGVWFLIGAALVFWMQAGFAMVETGFTREEHGQHPDEELDGLLHRHGDVHPDWLLAPAG